MSTGSGHRDMEIVFSVRAHLISRLGEDRFELWFGRDAEFEGDSESLCIVVDSAFRVDRIRARLIDDIRCAAEAVVGKIPAITFRVDANLGRTEDASPASTTTSSTTGSETPESPRIAAGTVPASTASSVSHQRSSPAAGAATPWKRPKQGRRFAKLDDFQVGPCNQLAFSAAQFLINNEPGQINPLFIHGPTGVGKTHLLEGIWSQVRRAGGRRIIYLSAEQFTTYFLQALRGGTGLPSFRQKYRAVDLFILDDVQFFEGKQATITELTHTIDALLRDSAQVVLAADRPAAELRHLGSDLQARISGGLVSQILPLDEATRLAVVRQLLNRRRLELSDGVAQRIAERMPGDARQLAGMINRLWAIDQTQTQPITLGIVDSAIDELCPETGGVIKLMDIQRAVCDEFGLQPDELCSGKRARSVSHPRMLAMWLARKYTRAALTEIGEFFGRRSHSTVVSAQNKVEGWVADGGERNLT